MKYFKVDILVLNYVLRHEDLCGSQLHAPADLTLVPPDYKTGYFVELVWTLRTQESALHFRKSNSDSTFLQPAACYLYHLSYLSFYLKGNQYYLLREAIYV